MIDVRPVQVADGVFFVAGPDVNWVILRDGEDVTLIDAGAMFNHGDAVAGLAPLEGLAADVLLPGHGPVHRGPVADAVSQARNG